MMQSRKPCWRYRFLGLLVAGVNAIAVWPDAGLETLAILVALLLPVCWALDRKASPMVEAIERQGGEPDGEVPRSAVVAGAREWIAASARVSGSVGLLVPCLLALLVRWFYPHGLPPISRHHRPGTMPICPVTNPMLYGAVFVLAISVALWLAYYLDRAAVAEASREGVATRSRRRAKQSLVPWEQIAECTVVHERGDRGEMRPATCILRNAAGKVLVRVDLSRASDEERRRFLDVVAARQGTTSGRTVLLSAAHPGGLGTELEMAQAPAGRGTELEAGR